MRTGWQKDPEDKRDHSASELFGAAAPFPESANNALLIGDRLDQTNNDCVANGIAVAVRASHILKGISSPPLLSRRFLYRAARKMGDQGDADVGAFIRCGFDALNKLGFCPEDSFPYDLDVNSTPNQYALRAAFDQRAPTSYRRIFETGSARVDMIKRAIAAHHLVVFGTLIGEEMRNPAPGAVLGIPVGPILGGHCMAVYGYDGDVFNVVNSWGMAWSEDGCVKMSADRLAWPETQDLWTVEAAPLPFVETTP